MEKSGIVTAVVGDQVRVSVARPGECGDKCATCSSSCAVTYMEVTVKNVCNAGVGDIVTLMMAPKQLVRLSFLLYTLPLMTFVLGVSVGYGWLGPLMGLGPGLLEVLSLGLGSVAMILTYLLMHGPQAEILEMTAAYTKDNTL